MKYSQNMGPKDGAIVESGLAFWDLWLGNWQETINYYE
jgi:hypothetical protein